MKKIFVIFILAVFLSACTTMPVTFTPTLALISTQIPTSKDTPNPTFTPTLTPTVTPSPQPAFKAGIPEKQTDCNNAGEMKLKADGSIDGDWLTGITKLLNPLDYQLLATKGITAANAPIFGNPGHAVGTEGLLYGHVDVAGNRIPLSCTNFIYQGHEYTMYDFAGKATEKSTKIGILHVLYDDLGNKLDFDSIGQTDYYNSHFTSDLVFQGIQTLPHFKVQIFVGGLGQSDNPDDINRWIASKALTDLLESPPHRQDRGTDTLATYLRVGFGPNATLSPEEEDQLIVVLGEKVFPGQTIGANKLQ